jgi:hypothetical protein
MLNDSDLRIIHFAPIEPDVISSEIWIGEERIIAELIWGFDGSKMLHLTEGDGVDLDAKAFVSLLSEQISHLDKWADSLREPGAAWDPDSPYYQNTENSCD